MRPLSTYLIRNYLVNLSETVRHVEKTNNTIQGRKCLICSPLTTSVFGTKRHALINPLNPSIHIQILQTDLHTFPLRIN